MTELADHVHQWMVDASPPYARSCLKCRQWQLPQWNEAGDNVVYRDRTDDEVEAAMTESTQA